MSRDKAVHMGTEQNAISVDRPSDGQHLADSPCVKHAYDPSPPEKIYHDQFDDESIDEAMGRSLGDGVHASVEGMEEEKEIISTFSTALSEDSKLADVVISNVLQFEVDDNENRGGIRHVEVSSDSGNLPVRRKPRPAPRETVELTIPADKDAVQIGNLNDRQVRGERGRRDFDDEIWDKTLEIQPTRGINGALEISRSIEREEMGTSFNEMGTSIIKTCESLFHSADPSSPPASHSSETRNSGSSFGESDINEDLRSAKKQLGATSVAFIERIQGGAQQRKLHVTRSRDLLVAKEKRQLQSIASSSKRRCSFSRLPPEKGNIEVFKVKASQSTIVRGVDGNYQSFKALPLPETTGEEGSGGDYGVPRVAKRPNTIPRSPLLGHRRQEQLREKVLKQLTKTKEGLRVQNRRLKQCEAGSQSSVAAGCTLSTISVESDSSNLLGLEVLGCAGKENQRSGSESNATTMGDSIASQEAAAPPQLHSTVRAEQRARYDTKRNEKEANAASAEQERLSNRIRRIRRELEVLRPRL